jgi:hypothetical protein
MTDADYFDGSTAARARKPVYVPSWLEQHGLTPQMVGPQYCQAIRDCLAGRISETRMVTICGMRNVIGS